MNSKVGLRLTISSAILLVFALSGCSEQESGFAEPEGSANPPTKTDTVPPQSTHPSTTPASSSIDPCDLLSKEDLADAGTFSSEYKEGGGARSCYWQQSATGGGDVFTFILSIRDGQGIDSVKDIGNGIEQTEVNQRPAVSTQDPKSGDCVLALQIGDSSRVDVTVLGEGNGLDGSCDIAEEIAGRFEAKLPASS
ncbi:DUF3558 domain-containing protein [Saccharomonospora azurea]|uniref:DUF3558 domain-containing protein n=1 Tax=Saccharomonospora azurea TaxID=40988 RepID=UPI00331B008F